MSIACWYIFISHPGLELLPMRGKSEDAPEDVNDKFNHFEKHGQRYSKPQGQCPSNWRA